MQKDAGQRESLILSQTPQTDVSPESTDRSIPFDESEPRVVDSLQFMLNKIGCKNRRVALRSYKSYKPFKPREGEPSLSNKP